MRRLLVKAGVTFKSFDLYDPDAWLEKDFERLVQVALSETYPDYWCFQFRGTFDLEGDRKQPDLAMVAKDHSHWFIIEVELVAHSFERHVLPQVWAFQRGTPCPDCISSLSRNLRIEEAQAETFLNFIPRYVVVVKNRWNSDWENTLKGAQVQSLALSRFICPNGDEGLELQGALIATKQSFGFGTFKATDRALLFRHNVPLPEPEVQILDSEGAAAMWRVSRQGSNVWVTKLHGVPSYEDGAMIQLIRNFEGQFQIRALSKILR